MSRTPAAYARDDGCGRYELHNGADTKSAGDSNFGQTKLGQHQLWPTPRLARFCFQGRGRGGGEGGEGFRGPGGPGRGLSGSGWSWWGSA